MARTPNAQPLPAPNTAAPHRNGAGLEAPVLDRMQAALGADLAQVRVHRDSLNMAMGARAYTHGANIHFAPGQYAPDNRAGRQLLARELVHVVQQRLPSAAPAHVAESDANLARLAAAAGAPAGLHLPE